jgi:hypothetical protein
MSFSSSISSECGRTIGDPIFGHANSFCGVFIPDGNLSKYIGRAEEPGA